MVTQGECEGISQETTKLLEKKITQAFIALQFQGNRISVERVIRLTEEKKGHISKLSSKLSLFKECVDLFCIEKSALRYLRFGCSNISLSVSLSV